MPTTNLPRRRPFSNALPALSREIDQLQANIRRMFDNPFAPTTELFATVPQAIGFMPPVEIAESAEEMTITAELPGMDQKDVHVELDGDVLTLRGEKQEERKEGDEKSEYHLVERSYGAFQRAFTLPRTVDPERITAAFAKGVLTVRLPKTPEARSRGREIQIAAK
jgi:HSP20 family protein